MSHPVQSPALPASVLSEQALTLQVYPVPLYEHFPPVVFVKLLQMVYLVSKTVTEESITYEVHKAYETIHMAFPLNLHNGS